MNCSVASKAFSKTAAAGLTLMLGLLALAPAARAQAGAPAVIALRSASAATPAAGGTASATLTFALAPGYHVNSNHPNSDFLIPTALHWAAAGGVKVVAIHWPEPEERKFSFSATPLAVFSGAFPVTVEVRAARGESGVRVLRGSLRYQACNDNLCRPPANLPVRIEVKVRPAA